MADYFRRWHRICLPDSDDLPLPPHSGCQANHAAGAFCLQQLPAALGSIAHSHPTSLREDLLYDDHVSQRLQPSLHPQPKCPSQAKPSSSAMEKSMKRVEKLVHATNSALAQMKFSLMFDDGLVAAGEKSLRRAEAFDGDDIKQCQREFTSEANEMLKKMDKMFGSTDPNRKNWKPLDRIKEINRKMNVLGWEHAKPSEMEQSREKLVSLIAEEKLSPRKTCSKSSLRLKPQPPPPLRGETDPPAIHHRPPARTHPLLPAPYSPAKEELKSNILETRQIVARGFHTARHLVQRVDSMTKNDRKEKTPCSEKNVSEINLKSLDGRSESNETTRSTKGEGEEERVEKMKKSGDFLREGLQSNARVVDVKRRECERSRRRKLRVQRLPSVHIRGGLQLQKVHSLEIPGGGDGGLGRANTGIEILSHEQIEKAKMEKLVDEVRKENRWLEEVGNAGGNLVECSNCGKMMRVQETRADPRRVDEILQKCNFDVFDPRIDEFVEKCGAVDAGKWWEKVEGVGEAEGRVDVGEKKVTRRAGEEAKGARGLSLEDLSNRVSSKYRQEAEALEGHHLRLDGLLKRLLRKIDESREALEECRLFREGKVECGRVLTTTQPIVVSLTGSGVGSGRTGENGGGGRTEPQEVKVSEGRDDTRVVTPVVDVVRRKRNCLRRRRRRRGNEMEERVMPRSRSDGRLTSERSGARREAGEEKLKAQSPRSTCSGRNWSPSQSEAGSGKAKTEKVTELSVRGGSMAESKTSAGGKSDSVRKAAGVTSGPSSSVSSFSEREDLVEDAVDGDGSPEASFGREGTVRAQAGVFVGKEGKAASEVSTERSENNYESDFESVTNEPEEGGEECEDAVAEVMPSGNKLSTISEVDSELERKLSDERRTQRGSANSEVLLDESRASEEGVVWKQQPPKGKKSISVTSEISNKSAKGESTPPEAAEASTKSTPTELVTSLQGILSALKDQFARTETLAEKLTENVKQDKGDRTVVPSKECSPSEDGMPSPWKIPAERLVENLRCARKEPTGVPRSGSGRSQKCEDEPSADSLSDEGGSSLGEVVVGGRRKCDSSSASEGRLPRLKPFRASSGRREAKTELGMNSDEASFSEGEIPSNLLLDSERCSSHSVGEVRH